MQFDYGNAHDNVGICDLPDCFADFYFYVLSIVKIRTILKVIWGNWPQTDTLFWFYKCLNNAVSSVLLWAFQDRYALGGSSFLGDYRVERF